MTTLSEYEAQQAAKMKMLSDSLQQLQSSQASEQAKPKANLHASSHQPNIGRYTPFIYWREVFRIYSEYEITQDNMYGSGETPEDETSAMLKVEVVHAIGFVDSDGHFHVFKMVNKFPKTKDKQPMGPLKLEDGYSIGSNPEGDGRDIVCKIRWVDYSNDEQLKNTIEATKKHMEGSTGSPITHV